MIEAGNPLEVRLYCNPIVKKEKNPIVRSILGGFVDYFRFRGLSARLKEKDWNSLNDIVKSARVKNEYSPSSDPNKYINADKVLRELGTQKVNIAHTPDLDIPHWDILFVPEYLVSNEGGNIYGMTSNYLKGKDSLASVIVSTADLKNNDELALKKGFILGNRFAFLTEGECTNSKCVGSHMDYKKLENMAKSHQNGGEVYLCGSKHRR